MTKVKNSLLQLFFITALLLGWSGFVTAQQENVEGVWFNDTKEAKIQIYKGTDGKLYGKIIWLKEPLRNGKPKLDDNNPDKKMKRQPVAGLVILKGFTKDGNQYVDGSIYDPDNGKTYDCKMTYKGGKTLAIRGYIGISLIGRTTVWERAG
jgi:uncharacterized protein (DUF2147 family)